MLFLCRCVPGTAVRLRAGAGGAVRRGVGAASSHCGGVGGVLLPRVRLPHPHTHDGKLRPRRQSAQANLAQVQLDHRRLAVL